MASPPSLVMLGLTLPDSRILSGIASIGLTLANIAVILPHLRQPVLDSIRAGDGALAHEQCTRERIEVTLDGSNTAHPVDLNVESPVFASVSSPDRERQSPLPTPSLTVKSVRSTVTDPLECLDIDSEVAPHTTLILTPGTTDDSQTPSQTPPQISPVTKSRENHISSSHLLTREGRNALHILLPVPDAAEVAFFDSTEVSLSNPDLQEQSPVAACGQHTVPEEHLTIEAVGPTVGKGIKQGGRPIITDLPSTLERVDIGKDPTDVTTLVMDENVVPTPTKVTARDWHNPLAEGTVSHHHDDLAARKGTVPSAQTGPSLVGGKEGFAKRRPESLEFIPQSVIRRYPSAPLVSERPCFGLQAFFSGHNRQFTPVSPHILLQNPAMLLEEARPRAGYTTLEGHWRAPFLTEAHLTRSMGGTTFVIETVPTQDPLGHGPASLSEPLTVHDLTPLRKYPIHRRRLGVLTRAALRNRRSTARRYRNDAIGGSSTSDSDSESDSDSQYSSGSSADESMLPRMLGADLIAAINANSESELNLVKSRKTIPAPLNVYEDFLVSEDSAAGVSMLMHVSSNDDAPDSEVRAPATSCALTYEDIQQWATGVVQECVRQVCRSRAVVEPLSPSQTSDVCAERPSGSGISQCPLSGLHYKLGAAASAEVQAPRTKELLGSLPPTSILPSWKPLSVRNIRDIPEFVPRQRHGSAITGRVEVPGLRKLGTRSTIDLTRDAATEVIARMESQAVFNARQRLVDMDEIRMVGRAGDWQGTSGRV